MKKLLNRLSLKAKIIMISWSFLIPVFFLLYSTISAYDKDILFARSELTGTAYLRPTVRLLTEISTYQQMLGSDSGTNEQEKQNQKDLVDTTFRELEVVQAAIGDQLQFTPSGLLSRKREHLTVENIGKQWSDLKPQSQFNKDTALKYRQILTDLRGIIAHAGDTSNLILDPDLDSYYLMDAVLISIPQSLDRLDQLETYLNSAVLQKNKAQIQTAVFEAMMREADRDRTFADFQTAISEDPNFYGSNDALQTKILPAFDLTKDSANQVLGMLLTDSVVEHRIAILRDTAALKKSTQALWTVSVDALDDLLHSRINYFSTKKSQAYAVSGVLVLVMIMLSFWSITRISNTIEGYAKTVTIKAQSLASVSRSLEVAVSDSASTSSRQFAAIEETVSSMEEMGSMIAMTNQSTTLTQEEVERSMQLTKDGESVVGDLVRSMDAISRSNEQLESMMTVIAGIQSKTKIINDIAFETKLLAFNASIEAARAGAHGRGFAVVAEEIGKLATVSNRAADEVRSLLEASAQQVSAVLSTTKESVEQGQSTTKACTAAFAKMQTSIQVISEGIRRIATASNEQKTGVTQTNQAMQELERVAQANLSSSSELQHQSTGLRGTAQTLNTSANGILAIVLGINSDVFNQLATQTTNETLNSSKTTQDTLPIHPKRSSVDSSKPAPSIEDQTVQKKVRSEKKSRWNAA